MINVAHESKSEYEGEKIFLTTDHINEDCCFTCSILQISEYWQHCFCFPNKEKKKDNKGLSFEAMKTKGTQQRTQ